MLWLTAYENGDPFIGSAVQVEAVAEFPGEAGRLVAALVDCGGPGRAGFLEPVSGQEGVYQVHDLFENAPEYVKKRKARADERKDEPATDTNETADNGGERPPVDTDRPTTAANGRQRPPMADNGHQWPTTARLPTPNTQHLR
jgi:hypothetical protein